MIHVTLLSDGESITILERALEPMPVETKFDISKQIARLSGGFPHPVHLLLGSECFDVDIDELIDEMDLQAAIHAVVTEKWKGRAQRRCGITWIVRLAPSEGGLARGPAATEWCPRASE